MDILVLLNDVVNARGTDFIRPGPRMNHEAPYPHR